MIILVNWVTNFQPPKFQKSSILTPFFQILGNTLPASAWLCKHPLIIYQKIGLPAHLVQELNVGAVPKI